MMKNTTNGGLGEPEAHVMMRHAKTILRVLLVIALAATIALLVYYHPAAYLAALPIPVLIGLLALVRVLERQSRASELRAPGQTGITQGEVRVDTQDAGIYAALELGIFLALGTFVIAAAYSDWELVGIVAAATLFLVAIIDFPYIFFFISQAARSEREKVMHRPSSSEPSDDAAKFARR